MNESGHTSVLLTEAVDALNPHEGMVAVDGTLGGAGHTEEIARRINAGTLLGIDEDKDALLRAREALKNSSLRVILEEGNFRNMVDIAARHGIDRADAILLDLGWSSYQLKGKGFSFQADEPLLMTYGDSERYSMTAGDLVNVASVEALTKIIRSYGEEPRAAKVARAIERARGNAPITTARELGEIIAKALGRNGKIHPATKTFQALRMAVNDELDALKDGLIGAHELLGRGGRIAIITFHSLEDRIVKHTMRSWTDGTVVTKKAIRPGDEEVRRNPRARSAKLRVWEKQ
jgi:16S rRNA (cytosine1402-N4)-methyltransferase